MKCAGIFSFQPDVLFIWGDKEFQTHLRQLSAKCGLDSGAGVTEDGIDTDVALQFFLPMVTSFQFMADAGNPYSSITTEDGKLIVLKQLNDLLYIAVCGDQEESEWYLTKKIHVLHQLVNILYGPSTNLLKPSTKASRQKSWGTLCKLLETWQCLSQQEQIFLVEAFERLLVNAVLNNTTLSLLEDVVLKANRDGHMLHSLLLVNNKLLGLYSTQCAPELQVCDVLLLTVIIKERFGYEDPTAVSSIYRTPQALVPQGMDCLGDEQLFSRFVEGEGKSVSTATTESQQDTPNISPKSEMFYSANSVPWQDGSELGPPGEDEFHTPRFGSPVATESDDHSPIRHVPELDPERIMKQASPLKEIADKIVGDKKADDKDNEILPPEYFQQTVFLKTVDCPFTPHTLHCILIDRACVLVLISESRCVPFATYIYHALSTFHYVLNAGLRNFPQDSFSGSRLFEKLDLAMRKLIDGIPSQSELQTAKLKTAVLYLSELWERAKLGELRQYLESERRAALPVGLTSFLPKLIEALKNLFAQVYPTTKSPRGTRVERFLKVINSIQTVSRSRLRDFSEFLQVRGQCNVTMTGYFNDFPGLVHFMYINRTANLLIAPTINVNKSDMTENRKLPLDLIIKQRVWDIWQYVEYHVARGYTSFVAQDGDFTYSYYLWFEDNMGKALPVQRTMRPIHKVISTGTLSGNFYRNLIRHCFEGSHTNVNCYELLCMHVGIVSKRFAATSAKKLARWLWESSGEANSPIGLL